ncbi:MAG: HEAT repeat domain-containing protein [Methanomicrobiales archaeon]|nr:HEAT repeat domain-containing protein [Methanomicrobiales archaeon]
MLSADIEKNIAGLRNQNKEVRAISMENLAGLGRSVVPALLSLLDDDNWVIRYRASEALGIIQDESTIESLIRMTTDNKDHVRYMAVKALAGMQDLRVGPVLIRMLSDDHSYTRKIAAKGLANAGKPDAIEHLEKALDCESDPMVRLSFEDALNRLKK